MPELQNEEIVIVGTLLFQCHPQWHAGKKRSGENLRTKMKIYKSAFLQYCLCDEKKEYEIENDAFTSLLKCCLHA